MDRISCLKPKENKTFPSSRGRAEREQVLYMNMFSPFVSRKRDISTGTDPELSTKMI